MYLWIKRHNIIKILILPKVIYIFRKIPFKIPMTFFEKIGTPMFKLTWNFKEPQIGKIILNKKDKVGGFTVPIFKTYCKATVIKAVW